MAATVLMRMAQACAAAASSLYPLVLAPADVIGQLAVQPVQNPKLQEWNVTHHDANAAKQSQHRGTHQPRLEIRADSAQNRAQQVAADKASGQEGQRPAPPCCRNAGSRLGRQFQQNRRRGIGAGHGRNLFFGWGNIRHDSRFVAAHWLIAPATRCNCVWLIPTEQGRLKASRCSRSATGQACGGKSA